MSDRLKFIVAELQKPPHNKNYNLITLDSLGSEALLQTVNDVIADIDSKHKMDIREEESESTAIRLLGMLRILKYKPPDGVADIFREGLVAGDKQVIYPVLEWLLQRIPDLKKRAYLAKYLVKLEVPPEISADADLAYIYEQYEELIEQFKLVHKEHDTIKNSGYSTAELRKDIEEMENEKEIVHKRIERMQRKVEGAPNVDTMIGVAKKLRHEKEREKEQLAQKAELRTSINHYNQRGVRLEKQLVELRQAGVGATPEGLVQKLEEETKVNSYIVKQKLPKELEAGRGVVTSLEKVVSQPAMGQDDIVVINNKIRAVGDEVKEMIQKKNVSSDPMEDKLTLFRQQAAIIARKKEATAEKLNDVRGSLSSTSEDIGDKKRQVESFAGETILRGDDFKVYVNALRTKSSLYKQKRAELSDLKAEYGVLARTLEVLKSKEEALQQTISTLESEKGVSGFRDTQTNLEKVATQKANLDVQKGQTLEDMSGMVHQLTLKISERKARLAPIIKELRPLRQQSQDMQMEYDEKRHQYDSTALQLQSNMSKLETQVKELREESSSSETKYQLVMNQKLIVDAWMVRVTEEMKIYVSKAEDKKKSLRDQYLKQISDGDRRSKIIKDEQKTVRDTLGDYAKQRKMWEDLEKLFECKKRCMEQEHGGSGTVHRGLGSETLVL